MSTQRDLADMICVSRSPSKRMVLDRTESGHIVARVAQAMLADERG